MRIPLFLMILIFTLSVSSQSKDQYAVVIALKANLRGTPSSSGKVIAEVQRNESLKVIETRGSWYLVQTRSYVGWLHGNTIKLEHDYWTTYEKKRPAVELSSETSVDGGESLSLPVPDADRVTPEWLSGENDDGYDIAISKYENSFLRKDPPATEGLGNPVSLPVRKLKRGDQLVILARTKTRNWVNVIDITSGKEGWVYIGDVKIYYTRSPKSSAPVFQERRTGSNRSPEIEIKNDTDRTLSLRVGPQLYEIESYSTRTIYLTQGSYKFYATVPRAYPLMGEKYWSNGSLYSWTFYIE